MSDNNRSAVGVEKVIRILRPNHPPWRLLPLFVPGIFPATPVTAQQFPPPGHPGPTPPAPPVSPESGDLFSSGFFLTLGFSFIVGLAVGYALKVAFKIALVIGGVLLIALFSLQYGGIIDVNWAGMQTQYDGFAGWLVAYAGALKDFMGDNLSNAASFTGGLLVGLKL